MRKIHVWLSLPAGLFITLICFTGAILVFQKEITTALATPTATEAVAPGSKPSIATGFFRSTLQLHRWLMFSDRPTGRIIVGVSTIFFSLILVSGFARWLRSKRYTIRKNANWHRKLFDHHRVWGFYAAAILLLCALTGLMWSFEWYRNAVAWLFDVEPANRRAMMRTAYSLHTGSWGGIFTKVLYFAAAIIGASLPITGYILHFRKTKVKNRSKK